MTDEQGEKEDGVAFGDGEAIYFVPATRLHEFKVEGEEAEALASEYDSGDVSGFQMSGIGKPMTFAVRGPVGRSVWNGEHLVYSPPPPPPPAKLI